jgi:hypothetical protein
VFLSFAREKLGGLVFVEGEAAFFVEIAALLYRPSMPRSRGIAQTQIT